MQRLARFHTGLIVLVIVTILLAACGGNATPDQSVIAAAVEATLTAIPQLSPQTVEITRVVEVEVTREVMVEVTKEKIVTPTPTASPRPTPTPRLSSLIPPRQAYSHSYVITEKYDRFSGNTEIKLDSNVSEVNDNPHGGLVVVLKYTGETPTIAHTIFLDLVISNSEWQFLKCHDLTLLVDGKAMPIDTSHDGSVYTRSVLEQVYGELTLEQFLSIVNAEKVEGKLCSTEFELTPAQMEALRDLASRMQP